jgi:hypothetical protein
MDLNKQDGKFWTGFVCARFEVFTAVLMKNQLWDMTLLLGVVTSIAEDCHAFIIQLRVWALVNAVTACPAEELLVCG